MTDSADKQTITKVVRTLHCRYCGLSMNFSSGIHVAHPSAIGFNYYSVCWSCKGKAPAGLYPILMPQEILVNDS